MKTGSNKVTKLIGGVLLALLIMGLLSGMTRNPKEAQVVGGTGRDRSKTDTRSESYGHFELTGSLIVPRSGHTATSLDNGNVLVTGGTDDHSKTTASAELYMYRTGQFYRISDMHEKRTDHTATKLQNGKVLICGGIELGVRRTVPPDSVNSVELYDPKYMTFSYVASMNINRWCHTSTLLNDGRVLVIGGLGKGGARASAEIYDPTKNIWEMAGTMNVGRFEHSSLLLHDGKVLVAGDILDFTRISENRYIEVYTPNSRQFNLVKSAKIIGRSPQLVELPDGNILAIKGSKRNQLQILNSKNYSVEKTITSNYQKELATATLINSNNVLIIEDDNPQEVFNIRNNQIIEIDKLKIFRTYHKSILLKNGNVLIVGGANKYRVGACELFIPNQKRRK